MCIAACCLVHSDYGDSRAPHGSRLGDFAMGPPVEDFNAQFLGTGSVIGLVSYIKVDSAAFLTACLQYFFVCFTLETACLR